MSENSSERLKEFRAGYASNSKRAGVLGVVQLVVVLAGFAAVIGLLLREDAPGPASAQGAGLSADRLREYAVHLEGKNLPRPAIAAYEDYLEAAELTAQNRAKVCYSIAKLAIEAGEFERALPHLYQAEFLDPDTALKEEINKKVVLCLDKLGRGVDLRQELRRRTKVKRTPEDLEPGETVLAEFAGEVLTDRDLEIEIDKLPASMRDSFNTAQHKVEFLKNMVAQRLLVDKARRLELDKDPEIQNQLVQQLDSMIVQKLIADEVEASINITPEDIERFYKAAPERFTQPATAKVRVAKAGAEEDAKALSDFPDDPVTVRKGGSVPGIPSSVDLAEAVFAAEPETVTSPVQVEDAWYVCKVESKTPERLLPFEEVKDRAARMLQMQKEQEKVAEIIEETLQARDVRLHLDELTEAEASQ